MTLRQSNYLMVSPVRYRDAAGRPSRVAFSARQAKLVVLDEATAECLEHGTVAELPDEQRERLSGLSALVPAGEDELGSVLAGYRKGSADPGLRNFAILPTSYCNMACAYCGQEHFKAALDKDRFDAMAARVEAAFAHLSVQRVVVGWFGGEPMLALRAMREFSARFVVAAEASGKPFSSRMPTNGSLLSRHTLQVLHDECRMTEIDVTLDGPEQIHNQRRLKRNGVGSFRRTIDALAEAVRDGSVPNMEIGIRVNIDQENKDHVADLIMDLACAGLASPQVSLHLMPVHSWGNDISAYELSARRYAQLEIEWFRLAQSLGIRFPNVPNVPKRTTCKATSIYSELIDQQGRIYSCSEHPLVPGVGESGVVGRVESLGISPSRPVGLYDDWFDQVGDGSQQCGRCPLLPVCGGACPKQWREGNIPCPSMKFNWIERLDLAAGRRGLAREGEAGGERAAPATASPPVVSTAS